MNVMHTFDTIFLLLNRSFRTVSHRLASQKYGYLRDTELSTIFKISTLFYEEYDIGAR